MTIQFNLSKQFLMAYPWDRKGRRKGNIPKVVECIKQGVDVNVQDDNGYGPGLSAAMMAVEDDNPELLKILSQVKTLNWNLQDEYGRSVVNMIGWSATFYPSEIMEILKKVENLNWNSETIWNTTIAIEAVKYRNMKLVQLLAERDDIDWNIKNEDGDTAVLIATKFLGGYNTTENLECLQLLLQKQREKIDWNVQSNYRGTTVAMSVASNGYVDCLKKLSQIKTIDWNIQDNDGWTAPMKAVMYGHLECVKVLLEIDRIDWNIRTPYDNCALILAADEHPDILQLLLSQVKNIDINHLNLPDEDDNENTPLLLAAKRGNIEILTIFAKHPGTKWELENREGKTALSVVLRNEELLQALVKELNTILTMCVRRWTQRM